MLAARAGGGSSVGRHGSKSLRRRRPRCTVAQPTRPLQWPQKVSGCLCCLMPGPRGPGQEASWPPTSCSEGNWPLLRSSNGRPPCPVTVFRRYSVTGRRLLRSSKLEINTSNGRSFQTIGHIHISGPGLNSIAGRPVPRALLTAGERLAPSGSKHSTNSERPRL
jgi:hypothetical protein